MRTCKGARLGGARGAQRQRCARALFVTLCVALAGCSSERGSPHAADGGSDLALTSVVTSGRSPFRLEADPIDRTHPAYGLTLHHMSNVLDAPRKDAKVLGYLRRGARFRASEEVGREGCARGWYEVRGGGFVCHGEGVLIDSGPPKAQDPPALPALSDPLPYRYMKTVNKDVPQFLRLPTVEEEQATLSAFVHSASSSAPDAGATSVGMLPRPLAQIVRMRMQPGFYVSIDREVVDEASGRTFVRTVRGGYIRKDQLIDAKLPAGVGVSLGGRYKLPIAFVYRAGAQAMRRDPLSKQLVKAGGLAVHSAHQLTGESLSEGGQRYYVTDGGLLLRESAIRVVDRAPRPKHTGKSERWIRVDLDRQTLTAYEADRPVFATLVSSGAGEHATPAGIFRLHAKHVATTMADDMAADGPYSIEDVPWTMYFLGGYALHAAFWHDKFGNRRSHGCVNLAPRDARWLFFWSAPEVPSGFHGSVAAIGKGTVVSLDTGVRYALEGG